MTLRIAVNGFGRIGRAFIRALLADTYSTKKIQLIAINLGNQPLEHADYLLRYDSTMRTLSSHSLARKDATLFINNSPVQLLSQTDASSLPWKELAIDLVVDCTGKFTSHALASQHISAGAKKVVISAPSDDADCVIIHGLNNALYDNNKHHIISLASCTTNCFAPLVEVITQEWQLQTGSMTTIHAYTNDQVLVDSFHKDLRRGRAASNNIIPTKTGADKAIVQLYPSLANKIICNSLRVPVATGSLVEFAFTTQETLSANRINETFKHYATTTLHDILSYTTDPLVSSDCIGSDRGAIFDSLLTQSTGTMHSIYAWYDNEYGYATRMKDFVLSLA